MELRHSFYLAVWYSVRFKLRVFVSLTVGDHGGHNPTYSIGEWLFDGVNGGCKENEGEWTLPLISYKALQILANVIGG